MKHISATLIAAALCGLPFTAPAQTPEPSPSAPAPQQRGDGPRAEPNFMDSMTADVRDRFHAARDIAMKDPRIQELRKKADTAAQEFREAMREAVAAADPALAEKVREYADQGAEKKPKWKKNREGPGAAVQDLQPEERDRLKAARDIAKQAPSVQAAAAAMKAAKTPEDRREAGMKFQEAMHAAILTADPSLAEVLKKIKPPHGPNKPLPPIEPENAPQEMP